MTDNGWDVVLILAIMAGLLWLSSCGTLHPRHCRTERANVVVVGTPEMRRCEVDACEAGRGQWIVDNAWMVEEAALMERLIERCEP